MAYNNPNSRGGDPVGYDFKKQAADLKAIDENISKTEKAKFKAYKPNTGDLNPFNDDMTPAQNIAYKKARQAANTAKATAGSQRRLVALGRKANEAKVAALKAIKAKKAK